MTLEGSVFSYVRYPCSAAGRSDVAVGGGGWGGRAGLVGMQGVGWCASRIEVAWCCGYYTYTLGVIVGPTTVMDRKVGSRASADGTDVHVENNLCVYRGTSPTRKRPSLGPYRWPIARVEAWS